MATALLAFIALLAGSQAFAATENLQANPIRRVVNMLQSMQSKVAEEGKTEEDLFDKFMCYCKTGVADLTAQITAAETKMPQVTSALTEATALKEQLAAEIKTHREDKAAAEMAISKATALRKREASAFAKESSDYKANIAAMTKALAAIERGAGSSFLQSSSAATLRRLAVDMEMSTSDRDMLSSFLAQGQGSDYVPQSGQITGILKQMLDTMKSDLANLTAAEEKAIADFEAMVAAKTKEINANQEALESKLGREAEVGVEIETLKEDLADTSAGFAEDKKFLAELEKGCATKQAEHDENVKTRAAELLAIGDTIKILNDDDALELFKKTLPAPSMLQMSVTAKESRQMALKALGKNVMKDPRINLIAMALKGHTKGFEKVLKMIDEMVKLLGDEQVDDDAKKDYCESKLDKAEDDMKILQGTIKDTKAAIAEGKDTVATLTNEIAALVAGINELDSQVETATANRKAENAEFEELVASDTAAKDIMLMAKNRLAKFYAPKMYKAPPKQELSAAGRVEANFGGAVLAQVSAHALRKDAPPPPPATWGAYQKKGEDSNGVIAMMDMLIADLDKEMTVAKTEEKEAQAEYETFLSNAKDKKAEDVKSNNDKTAAKADMESQLEKMDLALKTTVKEAYAMTQTIGDLHAECDWLLANYDSRKQARAGEIESLKNAKAVLSGADFSLAQTVVSKRLLRGVHRV